MALKAKAAPKEVEMIETEKESFEAFVAAAEKVRDDMNEFIATGYEILGLEPPEVSAPDGEGDDEGVDIETLDLDGLLEAAETYDISVPAKMVAKGADVVREFLKEALGLEEEAAEGTEQEEEEITTKVKAKLKQEIANKKVLKKR